MGKVAAKAETGLYASRVRVYPKAVHGIARNVKWALLVITLTIYYAVPWLRWDRGPGQPNQAMLLDLDRERFYFLNIELWPQDIYFLTGALILAAVSLFLVTSLAGRVWCGYTCPQTVWTDLFMWFERRIEGDRNARMKRDAGPTTLDKVWRKLAKHALWLGVAFWTGGAWIMYFVDAPTVTREFWAGQASAGVYGFTLLFTATTYVLAGWAREQVCTYMCPWPRFQASMLDEHSLVVTYQAWRGEPRGHHRRDTVGHGTVERDTAGRDTAGRDTMDVQGDCVDCMACVNVCPTGIDIRDGVQLECIGCGLCVDACNDIMRRTGQPEYLVTWDTLARQQAKAEGRSAPIRLLRPRVFIYAGALILATSVMVTAFAMRAAGGLSVQHDRAPLFVRVSDGALRNGYTVKISNKSWVAGSFALSVRGLPGAGIAVAEETEGRQPTRMLTVAPDSIGSFHVLVFGRPETSSTDSRDIDFVLRNVATDETAVYHAAFVGPHAGTPR